jgi:hypothetical protein
LLKASGRRIQVPAVHQSPPQALPPGTIPTVAGEGQQLHGLGEEACWADGLGLTNKPQDLLKYAPGMSQGERQVGVEALAVRSQP